MDVVTGWTGRTACALQAALRMSNVDFARHLDVGLRTVADWHDDADLKPRPDKQGLPDSALAIAPPDVRERFAVLTGQSRPAASAGSRENGPAADAERRRAADENISGALGRLDQLAGWQPGTARRRVAGRLRMECTGFGLNLVSGNFEFACLIVVDSDDFWDRFGGQIETGWESSSLRQYSSLDSESLAELAHNDAWSNEGAVRFSSRSSPARQNRREPGRYTCY
jgi:hypothetical protein